LKKPAVHASGEYVPKESAGPGLIFSQSSALRFHLLCLSLFCFLTPEANAQYFQQDVKYSIRVELDDVKHFLRGEETVTYKNNSPQVLKELYFHIWPAAYKDETTPLAKQYFDAGDNRFLVAKAKDLGDIDSLNFHINGEKATWNVLNDHPDICRITLTTQLNPGDSLTVYTPFRLQIPGANMSRLGHFKNAYYITQWYPKPAVYDKNGWNYFSYIDKGEFYSEFGSFDVYVTLPSNYLLAATGRMVDANEEITWLKQQDSLARTIQKYPDTDSFPPSSKEMKTIHFTQDSIHDFAWFADKRWHYLQDTLKLTSGKIINVRSFYNNSNFSNWLKANSYMKDAIRMHSELVGEYPYDAVTAIDAGAADGSGMEYPMITAVSALSSAKYFEKTIVHEVGHNWFYGMLATNERCHAWMDEGINKYYDLVYLDRKYKNDSTNYYFRMPGFLKNNIKRFDKFKMPTRERLLFNYLQQARFNEDQSPDICSQKYNLRNYNQSVYYKPALTLWYLNYFLGDSVFNSCMQTYFSEWKFRHPSPSDMKTIFETETGKDLSWCFDDLLLSRKKLDYSIKCLKNEQGKYFLTIKNTKQIAAPLTFNTYSGNKLSKTFRLEGFKGKQKIEINDSLFDEIKINGNRTMPELYFTNDDIRINGIFKKCGKIKFTFLTSRELEDRTQIFYSPVAGYNEYNGVMAGAVFHNISFLEKKFEYRLMPMYAFNTNNLAGGGDISYHFYPTGRCYRITVRSGISHYAFGDDLYIAPNDQVLSDGTLYFTKVDNRIIFSFRERAENKKIINELTLRHVLINRDIPYEYHYANVNVNLNYFQIDYSSVNFNQLDRGLRKFTVTGNNTFLQIGGELRQFITYGPVKKGFTARIYAGYLNKFGTDEGSRYYNMNMSGKSGLDDYLFDEVYFGRSEEPSSFGGTQFTQDYAGFKSPTSFYRQANNWMTGINVTTTLPGMIPFRLFASIGAFDHHELNEFNDPVSWEIGVDLPVIRDVLIVSLPFMYSDDIKYALKQEGLEGVNAIRFELHLTKLNPLDYIKNFYR
jgi:hypothetical protein